MRQMGRLDNFGIRRVERLDGNVGSPEGVAFWCSYLFPEEDPAHLNDIFHATPARPASSGRCPTCRAAATWTVRSTC